MFAMGETLGVARNGWLVPNIVTIYSVEYTDDVHFITMERVEGATLDQFIPVDGVRSDRLFDLALPLVDAVAAADERGITVAT
jgi:serine/threonine protein kinase